VISKAREINKAYKSKCRFISSLTCSNASLVKDPEKPYLSVVVPCFNEAAVLPHLQARLEQVLGSLNLCWEVILVDDGSSDETFRQITAVHQENPRFKSISLSRNFGHQAAITAGLQFAAGEVIAVMDADLQDPPEILPRCFDLIRDGSDIVYAVRRKRKENVLKRAAYRTFYRILRSTAEVEIPLDAGDFCVMSRRVAENLREMPERNVFVRGLRAWVGFRQTALEYEREARAAGETKYSLGKLCRLAADGVFSFSTAPLRLATYFGFFALGVSILAVLFVFFWRIAGFEFMGHTAKELPGWSAVVAAVLFFSGVQLLMLGLIGEYIGRIYGEVKQRPRWVIREALGIDVRGDAASAQKRS